MTIEMRIRLWEVALTITMQQCSSSSSFASLLFITRMCYGQGRWDLMPPYIPSRFSMLLLHTTDNIEIE
jgi:hypothetical protein